MRSKDITPHTIYYARVSGMIVKVQTIDQFANGDWRCRNLKTNREVRKSARQLRPVQ